MYAIKVTPNFYQGTCNAPQESYLTYRDLEDNPNNGTDDIAEFESIAEAEATIDKLRGDGPYYLSHGEAGAPSYEVVDPYDSVEDDCQNASGYELDCFEEVGPEDLPKSIKRALDGLNVDYHSSGDDYDVYADYYTDEDGTRYAIVYCPRTIALQLNADDLGDLNWDHPAYYKELIN